MKKELSILTQEQKQVILLREQGLTYQKIAERMGISINAVSQHLKKIGRKFKEYACYHDPNKRNDCLAEIALTYGELEIILSGLMLLERSALKKIGGSNKGSIKARLPYEAQIMGNLMERIEVVLYGRVTCESMVK